MDISQSTLELIMAGVLVLSYQLISTIYNSFKVGRPLLDYFIAEDLEYVTVIVAGIVCCLYADVIPVSFILSIAFAVWVAVQIYKSFSVVVVVFTTVTVFIKAYRVTGKVYKQLVPWVLKDLFTSSIKLMLQVWLFGVILLRVFPLAIATYLL